MSPLHAPYAQLGIIKKRCEALTTKASEINSDNQGVRLLIDDLRKERILHRDLVRTMKNKAAKMDEDIGFLTHAAHAALDQREKVRGKFLMAQRDMQQEREQKLAVIAEVCDPEPISASRWLPFQLLPLIATIPCAAHRTARATYERPGRRLARSPEADGSGRGIAEAAGVQGGAEAALSARGGGGTRSSSHHPGAPDAPFASPPDVQLTRFSSQSCHPQVRFGFLTSQARGWESEFERLQAFTGMEVYPPA